MKSDKTIRYWVELPRSFSGVIAGKTFKNGRHHYRDKWGTGSDFAVYFKTLRKGKGFIMQCPDGTVMSRVIVSSVKGERTRRIEKEWVKITS